MYIEKPTNTHALGTKLNPHAWLRLQVRLGVVSADRKVGWPEEQFLTRGTHRDPEWTYVKAHGRMLHHILKAAQQNHLFRWTLSMYDLLQCVLSCRSTQC